MPRKWYRGESEWRCTGCGETKPVGEFYSRPNGAPDSRCKVCKLAAKKQMPLSTTVAARFEGKVIRGDGCWLWSGAHSKTGRPTLYVGGRKFMELAYRVSWVLAGNVAPEFPNVIDHICRNPKCVRPDHLRVVLQSDNCGVLARPTPHWKNKSKTHCNKGHPLSGANLAVIGARNKPTRVCLTCYPRNWYNAVEKRGPPPGYRMKRVKEWRGPFNPNQ